MLAVATTKPMLTLTGNPKALSKDAVKRLEAIESLEDLGAGFALATHDLEIRGAGEFWVTTNQDKCKPSALVYTWKC